MNFNQLIIMDGATGTNLQNMHIPPNVWQGRDGCNEWLNLAYPKVIVDLHKAFIDAGSHAIETNTFGANRLILAEYGLADKVVEINVAAVECAKKAMEACNPAKKQAIIGSMGPGTKLPTLGQIDVDELIAATGEQAKALITAGVDAIILETCQDLLQVKLSVAAVATVMAQTRKVPLMVSVTVESAGTMLVGSDISAVCATLAPLEIACLGLNCATGPNDMESSIRYLYENWDRPITCMPNQGLPEIVAGKTVYNLSPQDFAQKMLHFVKAYKLAAVGGCCGTTPAHIKALADLLKREGLA